MPYALCAILATFAPVQANKRSVIKK